MRILSRHRAFGALGALAVAAAILSACVAEPGASADPSASADPAASSPAATASPAASLTGATVACPTPLPLDPATRAMVTTVDALAALGEAAAAICYGDAKLEVRGLVPPFGGGTSAYTWTPAWLASGGTFSIHGSRDPVAAYLWVNLPPSFGACSGDPHAKGCPGDAVGTWVQVVGHYNDPAAATCVATPIPDFYPPAPPMSSADAQLTCARQFVADSVEPYLATGPLPSVDPGLCPVDPVTVDQIVAGTESIGDQYGLGCLGSKELTFDAYVVPGVGLLSGMEQTTVEPRWLADSLNTGAVLAPDAAASDNATRWLIVRTPPDVPDDYRPHACDGSAVDPTTCAFAPYTGKYVTVAAHYDDPESVTCREVPAAGSDPLLEPAALVLYCREQLVVDSVAAARGPEPSATPPTTSTATRP